MADAAPDASADVARFCALTGADERQAAFMLEATHGSFEQAVQMYFDTHPSSGAPTGPASGAPAAGSARGAAAGQQQRQQPQQQRQQQQQRGGLLGLPFKLLASGVHAMASVVHLTLSLAAAVGDRVLPAAVMRKARGVARALLAATAEPPDAATQAAQFISAFDARYGGAGAPHPAWVSTGWRQAAAAAHQQFRFLFVYLHAPEHQDTDAFVRDVLCCPEVADYVNATFVAWGGDIRQPDAFALAGRLDVATYPCVALLAFSGQRTKLVAAAQGAVRPAALLSVLRRVQEDQGVMLTAERVEQEEREMSRRLLAEQNAEYEASLAADREREARRQQERERAEQEARARAAEEARARAEAEAAEQRRLQAAASIAARRERKAASLPPEPAAGAPGAATIRVRLPDGRNHQRRFEPDNAVQLLYDWVDSLEGFDCLRYSLVCAFPKRVFGAADSGGLSLAEAGLVPQGALFVQVHDDDDDEEEGQAGAA